MNLNAEACIRFKLEHRGKEYYLVFGNGFVMFKAPSEESDFSSETELGNKICEALTKILSGEENDQTRKTVLDPNSALVECSDLRTNALEPATTIFFMPTREFYA